MNKSILSMIGATVLLLILLSHSGEVRANATDPEGTVIYRSPSASSFSYESSRYPLSSFGEYPNLFPVGFDLSLGYQTVLEPLSGIYWAGPINGGMRYHGRSMSLLLKGWLVAYKSSPFTYYIADEEVSTVNMYNYNRENIGGYGSGAPRPSADYIPIGTDLDKIVIINTKTGHMLSRPVSGGTWSDLGVDLPYPAGYLPMGYYDGKVFFLRMPEPPANRMYMASWSFLQNSATSPFFEQKYFTSIPDGYYLFGQDRNTYIINDSTGDIGYLSGGYSSQAPGTFLPPTLSSGYTKVPVPLGFKAFFVQEIEDVYTPPMYVSGVSVYIINKDTGEIKFRRLNETAWTTIYHVPLFDASRYTPVGMISGRLLLVDKVSGTVLWLDWYGKYSRYVDGVRVPYGMSVYTSRVTYKSNGDPSSLYFYAAKLSEPPRLTVLNQNTSINGTLSSYIPQISVSDSDGDTLVSRIYLDGDTTPLDTRTVSNTQTAQMISFSALPNNRLTDGQHTLKFEVTDNRSTPVVQTLTLMVDRTPPVINSFTASSTDTSISMNATASDNGDLAPEAYRYSVGSHVSAWTNQASYQLTGLTSNTNYAVKLEVRDKAGNIAATTIQRYTKAKTPSLNVAGVSESGVTLTVSGGNSSATPVQIQAGTLYVTATGTFSTNPAWITPTNNIVTVTGLQPNIKYTFNAKAKNAENFETPYGASIEATTLAAPPASLTASQTQTSITIDWPATSGAINYDIEVDGVVQSNGTATSFTHSGLSPETRHVYRVRVKNAGGTGNWGLETVVFTWPNPPSVPQNLTATSKQTEVNLIWDRVSKAESYDLEVNGAVIELGNQLAYKHSDLTPESDHRYRIRARNVGGVSEWSDRLSISTLPYPPETPSNVSADPSIHSVTVVWSQPDRAVTYEVEVDGMIWDNGGSMAYVHDGLDPLSGHTYRIRAVNAGGKSAWSALIDVTTHPEKPAVPTNLIAISDETSVSLTWYKVAHAEFYEVEADGQIVVLDGADMQFVHIGLSGDSLHNYRVRAKNISGYSEWSTPVKMATMSARQGGTSEEALTNVAAVVTNTFITLTWDTVAPEAEYEIEVDGLVQSIGKDTVYHHTGLEENEFHTYKVRVKNDGLPGRWVAVLTLSTLPDPPDAVKEVSATATENSIELRWERVEGATGYEIEIDGKTFIVGADTAYLHDNLASGTSHTYRVRASNDTGVTAWSPALQKSTTNPVYTVNVTKDMSFNLTLFAHNVQDFGEKTYVVTYNPTELAIVDLYDFTLEQETKSAGIIPGTPLEVVVTPGRIEYRVHRNIVPGTSWSGEITTIKFKAKKDGPIEMKVTLE